MSKDIEIKNPIGMSAEKLKEYATSIGVDFTEDVPYKDLQQAVIAKNKELKDTEGNNNDSGSVKGTPNTSNEVVFYYWLKDPTYVDDDKFESKKLLPAGLYRFDRKLPRLEGQPKTAVEMWEGKIPERSIEIIAKSRGLVFSASDNVDFYDLLEKLVNEIVYSNIKSK